MKLTYMEDLGTSSIKLFAIIFSILMIFNTISTKAENDYSHIKTTIYMKDIDSGNNVLDGFKYKVIYEDGTEEAFENIEKGIHEITLEAGNYIIEESWTLEGYIKSKPLYISLPFAEEDGIKTIKSIYPKHKKKPSKPGDKDGDKSEYNNPWNSNDIPDEWSKSNNLAYSKDSKRKNPNNINESGKGNSSNLGIRDIYDNLDQPKTILGNRNEYSSSHKHSSTSNRTYSQTGNGDSLLSTIVLLSFNLMTLLIGFLIGSRIDFRDTKENKNEKQ